MFEEILSRALRAVQFDVNVYNEVESDENATSQALIIVVVVAICSAIASAIKGGGNVVTGIFGSVLIQIVGWLLSSATIYAVGVYAFGGTASIAELLRTLGYANAPGVLNLLTFIPVLGGLVSFVVRIWTLATTVVATREALDVDTTKAILIAIIALAIWIVFAVLIGLAFGAAAIGLGALFGAFS